MERYHLDAFFLIFSFIALWFSINRFLVFLAQWAWLHRNQTFYGMTTIYIYSGIKVIYEKITETGVETKYIGSIAKIENGVTTYYHVDHLGSTRQMTDSSGNALFTDYLIYKPFGEIYTGYPDLEKYLYNFKERDQTGLYYYGARYYDPKLGRFIQKDILRGNIKNPQSGNRYIYVLNNPLKYIDPTGNFAITCNGNCPVYIVKINYQFSGRFNLVGLILTLSTGETITINLRDPKVQAAMDKGIEIGYDVGFSPTTENAGNFLAAIYILPIGQIYNNAVKFELIEPYETEAEKWAFIEGFLMGFIAGQFDAKEGNFRKDVFGIKQLLNTVAWEFVIYSTEIVFVEGLLAVNTLNEIIAGVETAYTSYKLLETGKKDDEGGEDAGVEFLFVGLFMLIGILIYKRRKQW